MEKVKYKEGGDSAQADRQLVTVTMDLFAGAWPRSQALPGLESENTWVH